MDEEDAVESTRAEEQDQDIGIVKKEPEEENDIKDFAETTMNELLGWYGYDKVDSRYTQGLNLNRFTGSNKDGPHNSKLLVVDPSIYNGGGGSGSNCGTENSSGLDSPTGGSGSGGGGRTSCSTPPPQSQASPNMPNGYVVCAWCQKVGMKLFTLRTNHGVKAFCSELCFTQCRRASFKKYKVCDWCKHIRHTVNYVDFQDGEQQLQFCSDKCLNQYKMNIFCRETQAHLQMHPHLRDAASKMSVGCTSSTSGGGASGSGNMTLITPDLWLRDCKGHDSVNGYSDDHLSSGESGDKSDGPSQNNDDDGANVTGEAAKSNSDTQSGGHFPKGSGGKENLSDSVGGNHRHSRIRERDRKRHRHQSNKGGTQSSSQHFHHRDHHHHIRHVLDKSDRLKSSSSHRSPSISCKPADGVATVTSVPQNGINGLTGTVPNLRLSGGSPTSVSSLNILPHATLPGRMLPVTLPSTTPLAPPAPAATTSDLLRPPVPVVSPQSLFLPQPPLDPLRLPPLPPGIRPQFPFVWPPGMQLPPSLQPFLAHLPHVLPSSTAPPPIPPRLPHPPMANNPLSSLLPPVTVMVPYPVILPVPIPIPIPIPLPIPMKGCEMPTFDSRHRSSFAPVSPPRTWNPENNGAGGGICDRLRHVKKAMDDHSPSLHKTFHQNPSKRVDSVITRLVNSKMSQTKNDDLRTMSSGCLSAAYLPQSNSVAKMPFLGRFLPAQIKEEPRDDSQSPSELDDRPSIPETVHSLLRPNPSSKHTVNHFTESTEDDDSFSCPGSEPDVDSDDSYSTFHSESRREIGTSGVSDGLCVPSSPTSRLRHRLLPVDDREPDMKRKCVRARLLAK